MNLTKEDAARAVRVAVLQLNDAIDDATELGIAVRFNVKVTDRWQIEALRIEKSGEVL